MKSKSDTIRELIQLYHECGWRQTQLQIIQEISDEMGGTPENRGLEFLIEIAQKKDDPLFAESAIAALGKTHSTLAGAFLSRFYLKAPEDLKPSLALALARIPDRSSWEVLLKDLKDAWKNGAYLQTRALILALGDLKVTEALPTFREILKEKPEKNIAWAIWISMGRLSREESDLKLFERAEADLGRDPLERQIFESAKNQIVVRSQWKLEDYLHRLFAEEAPHRMLPLELLSFKVGDVLEGLALFREEHEKDASLAPLLNERILTALRYLTHPEMPDWYRKLVLKDRNFNELRGKELTSVVSSIAFQRGKAWEKPLALLKEAVENSEDAALTSKFLSVASLVSPDGLEFFAGCPDTMETLNALSDYALTLSSDAKLLERSKSDLNERVLKSKEIKIQARALRTLGRLQGTDQRIIEFAKKGISEPHLTASCLNYFEACPSRSALSAIASHFAADSNRKPFLISWLRALRRQENVAKDYPGYGDLLKKILSASDEPETITIEALRLVEAHPLNELLPAVEKLLQSKSQGIQLQAVISLRGFKNEKSAEPLAPLLASQNSTLSGRALDTLTLLPGIRARRMIIDYLKENSSNTEVCEKIIRCLNPLENGEPLPAYFTEVIDGIVEKNPEHPEWEGLIALKERLGSATPSGVSSMNSKNAPLTAEALAVDADLQKQLQSYADLDDSVKTALRSAELPFSHPELFSDSVDKASSVLEYCKALDLQLEKTLGRDQLFPKIERSIQDFQTVIHWVGLEEESIPAPQILAHLGLTSVFTVETLPLHKMRLLSQQFLTGRIIHDRFKALDGLRAWGVILLLFARKLPGRSMSAEGGSAGAREMKPPLVLKDAKDTQIVALAKRLIALQEIRNPAAHRQTFLKITGVGEVRTEALELLGLVQKWMG